MKKKVAVILCLALCAMTMFGCSAEELGYLKLAEELTKIQECEMSGSVELYYDAEKLKDYIIDNVDSTVYTKEELEEQFSVFTGKATIEVSYNGSMRMTDDDVSIFMNLSGKIDGNELPLGKVYFSLKDGVYVERDMLLNLYSGSKMLLKDMKDSYFYSAEYEKDLREALGTSEYLEIVSADQLEQIFQGQSAELFKNANENSEKIYKAAITFLTDAFSGYNSGLIKSTSNGYTIFVNGTDLTKTASNFLDYCTKNVDQIVNSLEVYINAINELMISSYPAEMQAEIRESGESVKWSSDERAELAGQISAAKGTYDYWLKDGKLDFLKAISYEESIAKIGDSYIAKGQIGLKQGNADLAYIKCSSKVTAKKISVDFPAKGTPIDEIANNIAEVDEKHNPVVEVEIIWDKYSGKEYEGESFCDLIYKTKYPSPLNTRQQYSWSEYYNVNKSMHIAARTVCELLGEDVQWDNKAKQAYVIKDGNKILMSGILNTDKVYVKVTDFEKLGYTVTYDGSIPYQHSITITEK